MLQNPFALMHRKPMTSQIRRIGLSGFLRAVSLRTRTKTTAKRIAYSDLSAQEVLARLTGETQAGFLMEKYASLSEIARADEDELQRFPGIGPRKATLVKSAFSLALKLSQEVGADMPLMDSPERVADLLREEMRAETVETFYILLLNARRRLVRYIKTSSGTLDSVAVHPRDVFRHAIQANAHALVLVHNHPSSDPTPSDADVRVTRDLIRAGQLLKIELLDHVILGARTTERPVDFVSLRELGYFFS